MKPFCPILTIGFAPPKDGERDMRRCTTECALFDKEEDQCAIKACVETLRYLSGQIDDGIAIANNGFIPFEEDCFDYEANSTYTPH